VELAGRWDQVEGGDPIRVMVADDASTLTGEIRGRPGLIEGFSGS